MMQKCKVLWNAADRSKLAEVIQSILGHHQDLAKRDGINYVTRYLKLIK